MDTDTLDNDFRDFVRRRDPAALAAVFDAAAPRLLLVAMHLTRDAATAEDLVQTVFLQVLRDAGSFDLRRPVMPWLLALLEHRASDGRRRAHRQHERADAAVVAAAVGRDRESAPPQLAADAEARQRVAEALAGMPGDYRQVLTLRLVHGIAAVDIAHSLGIPPATVRTRLSRGLQLLRGALPRGLATPALLAWLGSEALRASSGLQAVRSKVLAAVGGGAAATAAGLWLAAVVVLLVALGWWGWQQVGGSDAELASPGLAASTLVGQVAADRPDGGAPRVDAGDEVASTSLARTAAADPRTTRLRGVVVAREDGHPLAGVQVTLRAYPNAGHPLPVGWAPPAPLVTDAAGRFALALVPPVETGFELEFQASGRIVDSVWWESLREAVDVDVGAKALQLGTPLVLEVRRDGAPAGGIDLGISRWQDGQRSSSHRVYRSDASGRVDLGHVEPGRYGHDVEVALRGASGDFDVPLQATPWLEVIELHAHPAAAAITGRLFDPSGAPLPNVKLAIPTDKSWGYHTATTDDAGRFAFVRDPKSPSTVSIQLWVRNEWTWVVASGDLTWGSHDLRLVARRFELSALRLRCIDAETRSPITEFGASCWPDPWAGRKQNASLLAQYGIVAAAEHADGSVLFEGLPPGAAFVSVFPVAPYAELAEHSIVLEEGRVHTLQVELRRPVVCTVRAVDAGTGAELGGIEVVLAKVLPVEDHGRVDLTTYRIDLTHGRVARGSSTGTQVLELARGLTDAAGTARLVVPPDLPALVLIAEGPRCQAALRKDVVIARDGTELVIAVQPAAEVRGTVTPLAIVERFGPTPAALAELAARARVENVDAEELADEYPELHLRHVGATVPIAKVRLRPDGSFAFRSLPPGRYEAWLRIQVRDGRNSRSQSIGPLATFLVTTGPTATVLSLDAEHWLPGRLDLRLLLDGAPHRGNVLLCSHDFERSYRSDDAGRLRTEWLPPGTYHACVDLADAWPHQMTFDPQPIVVAPGAFVEAVASCARREVTVELRAAAGAELPAHCWLLLRALDHPELHGRWIVARVDERGVARFLAAPPGRLQVDLLTMQQFDDRDLAAAVRLGELAPAAMSLRCTLPH